MSTKSKKDTTADKITALEKSIAGMNKQLEELKLQREKEARETIVGKMIRKNDELLYVHSYDAEDEYPFFCVQISVYDEWHRNGLSCVGWRYLDAEKETIVVAGSALMHIPMAKAFGDWAMKNVKSTEH